jgi:hypothetical protein
MYVSPKLEGILNSIKQYSHTALISNWLAFTKSKVDYLDFSSLTNKSDEIVFTGLPTNVKLTLPIDDPYTHGSRQTISLGKILNAVAPNEDENAKRKLIELISARIKSEVSGISLDVISGEDIRAAYNPKNYGETASGHNLNSCMALDQYQINFDMYCYNPETVKMVRATNKHGKVVGRSLLFVGYSTVADLEAGIASKLLMGRHYTANSIVKTLLTEWGKLNADFSLEGKNTLDKLGGAHVWPWYIPLKYWDLNYYCYMDHFSWIYKNLVKDVGVWSNDGGYSNHFHWIQPNKDSYKDSQSSTPEAKLDPLRPGMVYIIDTHSWASEDNLVKFNGKWVSKDDLVDCEFPLCKRQNIKKNMYKLHDNRQVCNTHSVASITINGVAQYALQSEAGQCAICSIWSLSKDMAPGDDKVCNKCVARLTECELCTYKVDSNFIFVVDETKKICPTCADKGQYFRCDDCFVIRQNVSVKNGKYLCQVCNPPVPVDIKPEPTPVEIPELVVVAEPAPTSSKEKYVDNGGDIEISPNAIKIIV